MTALARGIHTGLCDGCGVRRILVRVVVAPARPGHPPEVGLVCRTHQPCGSGLPADRVMTLAEDLSHRARHGPPLPRPQEARPTGPEV